MWSTATYWGQYDARHTCSTNHCLNSFLTLPSEGLYLNSSVCLSIRMRAGLITYQYHYRIDLMFSAIRWRKVSTYFTVGHRKERVDIRKDPTLVWFHDLSYDDTIIITVTIIIMINTSRTNCHMLLWQPIKCMSAALLTLSCCGRERDLNVYNAHELYEYDE